MSVCIDSMGNTTDQADGATRRRSLLPQRSSDMQASTRMGTPSKGRLPTAEKTDSSTTVGSNSARIVQATRVRTTSMLPPARLGRSQAICEPARTSSLRRSSTNKPASQGPFETATETTTSSIGQKPHSSARSSFHGRSVSHQVEGSAILATSTSRTTLNRQASMRGQKPTFTAMQQSFSPKRSVMSRPSTSSSQSIRKDDISSADCFHLQMELTQLHLLHRSAQSVQHQWEQSVEETFRSRFAALAERHTELKEIAQQQQALINQLAVVQWSDGKSGAQLAEKVALLSRTVAEICSLLEIEGKYTRILAVFESWFSQVLQIRKQRKPGSGAHPALDFVEGIGDGWKAEAIVLERDLIYCSSDLKPFGIVRADSSLGRIQSLYSKLVLDLIEEIDVIQWIENEITIQETLWVENTIHRLASDVDNDLGSMASNPIPVRI